MHSTSKLVNLKKEKAFTFMLYVHVSYQEPHLINCTTWGWPSSVSEQLGDV